jgi:hypothetical protein
MVEAQISLSVWHAACFLCFDSIPRAWPAGVSRLSPRPEECGLNFGKPGRGGLRARQTLSKSASHLFDQVLKARHRTILISLRCASLSVQLSPREALQASE